MFAEWEGFVIYVSEPRCVHFGGFVCGGLGKFSMFVGCWVVLAVVGLN